MKKNRFIKKLNNNEVKEVAKMQKQIDDYQSLVHDIAIWLSFPEAKTAKSNIDEADFIYRQIRNLQNK